MNRGMLRRQAKKIYKENVKNVPKSKRISFAEFFKKYRNMKNNPNQTPNIEAPEPDVEDFDFEDLVNISEINDDDLEVTEEEIDQDQE